MPTNENFFTRERLQAIGMGIGRGFQTYDPNNPFAGAGAAMEATIGTEMAAEAQRRQRSERMEDLAAIERKQIGAEKRSEERQIRDEERQRANARKDQQEMLDRFRKMRVGIVDRGQSRKANEWKQFSDFFANLFLGNRPRLKGKSPISLFDESMVSPSSPSSPSNPVSTGDPDKWDESMDAVDPYGRDLMNGVK